MNLNNKDVLLFAPQFYGYENAISDGLLAMGANVTYLDCNPNICESNIIRIFRKLNFRAKIFSLFFEIKKWRELTNKSKKKKYDIVLIVCAWAISDTFLAQIKDCLLKDSGRMILYYWDSRHNVADNRSRFKYFNRIYSFDSKDCEEESELVFLPLFYRNEYLKKNTLHIHERKYDLAIVASYNLFRYLLVEKLKQNNPQMSIYSYLYANRFIILLHKIFRKSCKNVDLKKVSHISLLPEEITSIYESSAAILDFPHPNQNGLSIRTFECMAMEKKMVTTNINVEKYDFYNTDNIYILSDDMELPVYEWFGNEYHTIESAIVDQYSIKSWIDRVLSE